MDRYLMSPFSGDSSDLDRIRDFAIQSHDVEVVLDAELVPFVEEDLDEGVKNLLLIGFVAGDAASQLRAGVRRDNPLAGVEGELAIYLVLKSLSTTKLKDRKVISARLDDWLVLRAKGELRAHLERTRAGQISGEVATGATDGPATDSAEWKQVLEATRLVQSGQPQEAITGYLDKVIASYQARYASDKRRVYCGHAQAETLKYMLDAAERHEDAVALDATWAEAWFVKSYALTELHHAAAALSALESAIALSPSYPAYLSERGYMYQQAKDWKRALQSYAEAESSVKLLADRKVQIIEHTRALRGQGYALVELGDLDAAARKYQHSLALNPDDTKAKQELEYINDLRARRK